MSRDGDNFVLVALERTGVDIVEHLREAEVFLAELRARPDDAELDVVWELRRQAAVRLADGDPSAAVWLAWARARETEAAFAGILDSAGMMSSSGE